MMVTEYAKVSWGIEPYGLVSAERFSLQITLPSGV